MYPKPNANKMINIMAVMLSAAQRQKIRSGASVVQQEAWLRGVDGAGNTASVRQQRRWRQRGGSMAAVAAVAAAAMAAAAAVAAAVAAAGALAAAAAVAAVAVEAAAAAAMAAAAAVAGAAAAAAVAAGATVAAGAAAALPPPQW